MTRSNCVLSVGFLALAGVMLATWSAQAQSSARRQPSDERTRITEVDENGRVRTRLTVRRRSFLDPGSEVTSAFQDHYHDYALPPGGAGTGFHDKNNYNGSFSRMPLPGPFDLRGYNY